jgi:PIN domain nuclease of toxin-antitoxin system
VPNASAVLALLQDEPGASRVERHLGQAVMSTVNWAEVAGVLDARGLPPTPVRLALKALGIEVEVFDVEAADESAALWTATRDTGLSLADRACLAVARRLELPAVTAERAWLDLDVGVDVQCIR